MSLFSLCFKLFLCSLKANISASKSSNTTFNFDSFSFPPSCALSPSTFSYNNCNIPSAFWLCAMPCTSNRSALSSRSRCMSNFSEPDPSNSEMIFLRTSSDRFIAPAIKSSSYSLLDLNLAWKRWAHFAKASKVELWVLMLMWSSSRYVL